MPKGKGKKRGKGNASRGGANRGGQTGGGGGAPTSPQAAVLDLQSKAGNAAVADSVGGSGDAPLSQKEIRSRIRAGNQRRAEEKQKEHDAKYGWFGSETWLGWGLEKVGMGWEGDSDGDPDFGESTAESDAEAAPSSLAEMVAPDIEITLVERELATQLAGGDLTAKAALNASLEGFSGAAEFEWTDGTKGEASTEPFRYDVLGTTFTGTGTLEGFEGVRIKGKGEIDLEHVEVDLSYFDGTTVSTGGNVSIKCGDTELIAAKGSVGFAAGTGGRFAFTFKFAEGTITLATGSTTAVAGVGLTWDYKIELKTQAIASSLWSWLPTWSTLSRLATATTGLFGYSSTSTDAPTTTGTPPTRGAPAKKR